MTMTKKAQREAEVIENRKVAYVKKVHGLLGHVAKRLSNVATIAAFDAGTSAEDYATEIAAKEPVGACIMPMKVNALELTEQRTRARIAALLTKLEENGGDMKIAFPFNYSDYSDAGKEARALNEQVRRFTKDTEEVLSVDKYRTNNYRRVANEEGIEHFVQNMRDLSANQYDAFICKMVGKVGEVDTASIEGNHVWGNSVLTVAKGATTEVWHTQMIMNFSKYGLAFNQFPSRKIATR